MPEKKTLERAQRDRRQGKAATTQAGEFVREEMEHVKRGKHAVTSRKQAVAIGLSKARRAGVKLPKRSAKSTSKKSAAGARRSGTGATTAARKPAARKSTARAEVASGAARKKTSRGASSSSSVRKPAARRKASRSRAKR